MSVESHPGKDVGNSTPVSALRSKFEKLAHDVESSVPARPMPLLSTLTKNHEVDELLLPSVTRQRSLSGSVDSAELTTLHLRASSSASDLKVNRRPPPPPPPRSPKPYFSPTGRPIPAANTTYTENLPGKLEKSVLIARKPPPPPSEHSEHAPESLTGAVASIRSKFVESPSFPSSRPVKAKPRIASHSSAMSNRPESPHHFQRHSVSNFPDVGPLAHLANGMTSAPPLPSRPPVISTGSHSSTASGSSSPELQDILMRPPPPSPSKRSAVRPPPPRHVSLPLSTIETSTAELGVNTKGSSSTPTLQIPPPLPFRRSPPIAANDLPSINRLNNLRGDTDPHQGLHSAPPLSERKPTLNEFAPPPVRTIALGDKLPPPRRPPSNEGSDSESGEDDDTSLKGLRTSDLLPDASHASRRPPIPSSPAFATVRIPVVAHQGVIIAAGSRVIVSHHHVKVYDLAVSDQPLHHIDLKDAGYAKDPRVSCIAFRPIDEGYEEGDRGRYAWLGTRDGSIWELDSKAGVITGVRHQAHSAPVVHILRHGHCMVSIDESGKALVYIAESAGCCATMLMQGTTRVVRIAEKQTFAHMFNGRLWTANGPGSGSADSAGSSGRGPAIRVYDVLQFGDVPSARTLYPSEQVGAVTSGTVLQTQPGKVFLGHEGGFITIWECNGKDGGPSCAEAVKISATDVLCLEGVGNRLWAGNRRGQISAYDVESRPWVVTNNWKAHADLPVQKLCVDPFSIEKCTQLLVLSVGRDEQARFWDGLLGIDWIDNELTKRETSFSAFRELKTLIVSWNVDAAKPDTLTGPENSTFLDDVLHSVDSPDIIVFGFQELIDLESRKMAAKTVLLGSKKKLADGSMSEKVSRSYKMWHDRLQLSVRLAMPVECPYTVVHAENLVGLFTCIFVKSSEAKGLREPAITTVKRGIGGIYGNKGGIVSRLVIDDTSVCFINCHLAAGQHHVRARNADVAALLEEKEILPISNGGVEPVAYVNGGDGSMILDHEIVFLNGDLNYRIEQRREACISAIEAGQFESLLVHDQLLKEMRFNRGSRLRAFSEAPITFNPTYKYDRRSSTYDSGEKRRIPAWCDRVLYRARNSDRVRCLQYRRWEANVSDHRPVSAVFGVTVKAVDHVRRTQAKEVAERLWEDEQPLLLTEARAFFEAIELL